MTDSSEVSAEVHYICQTYVARWGRALRPACKSASNLNIRQLRPRKNVQNANPGLREACRRWQHYGDQIKSQVNQFADVSARFGSSEIVIRSNGQAVNRV
jgi:hypothetical protein